MNFRRADGEHHRALGIACFLLAILLAVPAILAAPAGPARDGGGTFFCALASGQIPAIDGNLSSGEWSAANTSAITLNGFYNPSMTITANWSYMSDSTDLYIAVNFSVPTTFLVLDIDDKEDHSAGDGGEDYVRMDTGFSDRYWSQTSGDWLADTGAGGTSDGAAARSADARVYEVRKPLRSGDNRDFWAMPGTTIGFRIETYSGSDYYRFPQNTVDHDLNHNGNLGDEMAAWTDLVLADTPNAAPVLSLGGCSPQAGNETTPFLFLVTYADADNDAPACASVVIDGIPRAMGPAGNDYVHGVIFSLSTTLKGGMHNHFFNFSDGRAWARLPASGTYDGPDVEIPVPPTISAGIVVPANGTTLDVFRYKVRYNDSNGDAPIVHKVNIDGAGHDMTANGTDFKAGVEYFYDTTLSAGNHEYSFFFGDTTGSIVLPPTGKYPGPMVRIPNERPEYNESANHMEMLEDSTSYFDLNSLFWDPDGDQLSFEYLGGASGNLTVEIAANGSAMLKPAKDYFTAQENLNFIARDPPGENRTGWLTVRIRNVNDPPHLLPDGMVPDPLGEIRINESEAQTFRVLAADVDNKTAELRYSWFIDDVEKTKVGTTEFTWRPTFDDQGPHHVMVLISDGLSHIIAVWNMTVNDTNRPPLISENWPQNNTEVAFGTSISFCATALDPDGDPVTFYWRLSDGTLLKTQSGVSTSSFSKVLPGGQQHLVVLEVQDGRGGIARQYIYVNVAANILPVAVIDGPAGAIAGKGANFSAQRSSDSDGRIVKYAWDFGDGSTAEGANVTHVYKKPKSPYTVTLTVTDDGGSIGAAYFNLTVKSPPAPAQKGFIPGFGAACSVAAVIAWAVFRRR